MKKFVITAAVAAVAVGIVAARTALEGIRVIQGMFYPHGSAGREPQRVA